jgi:hypothetical protein
MGVYSSLASSQQRLTLFTLLAREFGVQGAPPIACHVCTGVECRKQYKRCAVSSPMALHETSAEKQHVVLSSEAA